VDSFRDLVVWQKAMVLATEVYRATTTFPQSEIYGLTSQMRRASVAVPSDIAEGKGRLSKKEFVQMLSKARGSLQELDTQVEIAKNLGYLEPDVSRPLSTQCDEVGRLLNGPIRSIQVQIEAIDHPPTPKAPEHERP
jgi:four helix bundle protein